MNKGKKSNNISSRVEKKTPPVKSRTKDIYEVFENLFLKREKQVFYFIFISGFLFSLLLFDFKISEGNDDALYIEGGYNYAKDFSGYYFTANAPLYPMLLGIVIKVVGLKLIVLKLINVLFFLAHLFLMFLAFRRRIPGLVFYPILFLVAINSYFLYFASQTYTESLFLLLQALFVYVFLNAYDRLKDTNDFIKYWKSWLLIGITIFLLTFCKNIAVGSIGALIIFFLIERKYFFILYSIISYLAIRLPFELIRSLVWGSQGQYGSQTQILRQKDPYDASKGMEDFSGFITRFIENFNLYISKRLFQILGFRSPEESTTKGALVVLFIILTIIGIYWIIKKRKNILIFIFLYTSIMMGLTFFLLQTRWDQPRFIMVYVPMILLIIFYGLYAFFKNKGFPGQFAYLVIISVFVMSSLLSTLSKSVENIPVLKKNISGDPFYGYTPDWINYLKMSAWCGKNLPQGSLVACRKAPMSFVYGNGMKFYPVYSVLYPDSTTNLSNPDSVLSVFKRDKVTHVILASLRRNPKKVDGYVINTLHRMMEPIARKYPEKIKLIKQEGTAEPSYLYEINY